MNVTQTPSLTKTVFNLLFIFGDILCIRVLVA